MAVSSQVKYTLPIWSSHSTFGIYPWEAKMYAHTKSFFFFFLVKFSSLFFFFFGHAMACGNLVPRPGIEPGPLAVRVQSPNHWTAREFPLFFFFPTQSYTPMFRVALFVIAPNWKQPRCPEQINSGTSIQWNIIQPWRGMNESMNIHKGTSESQKHHAEWKKPATKDYILYGSIYMKF